MHVTPSMLSCNYEHQAKLMSHAQCSSSQESCIIKKGEKTNKIKIKIDNDITTPYAMSLQKYKTLNHRLNTFW